MARYRYKRGRRGYKRTTQFFRAKFQSFMDIHTMKDEMQIISISAGGKNLLARCPNQFSAFKYYRIGNISAKLVPASTLPVDPTGLSYTEGEQTVDPRDQLTPGMMRITNGEDVFEDLTGMSAENQHKLYNSMMLDPRWFKWMLQRGVKRHAMPRYWTIGQLHQDKWPGFITNVPRIDDPGTDDQAVLGTSALQEMASNQSGRSFIQGVSSPYGFFQTGHKGVLGWLPTDAMQSFNYADPEPLIASPPEIEVMKIILPPAYKTEYYYRLYISETVYFREPIMQAIGTPDYPFRPLDVFHASRLGVPLPPTDDGSALGTISDSITGGNYGGN